MDKLIYHYCDNYKMANILSGKTLRMSDITKSNDYEEVKMFFPGILDAIEDEYRKYEFPLQYMGIDNRDALGKLLDWEYSVLNYEFDSGGVTNFVVCFCEDGDVLSQWRGYADNGKGCSLGFSIKELEEYCNKYEGILQFKKVEYKTVREINDTIVEKAIKILNKLSGMRNQIAEEIPSFDDEKIDRMFQFYFHQMISNVLMGSLKYKNETFREEKEWRIFFSQQIYKYAKWIYGDDDIETVVYDEMLKMLRNKIEFNVTGDDIIPFYPINILEISDNPIKEIIVGPRNKILQKDFSLYVASNRLSDIKFRYSRISYRG
ncbi:MAG: DUF2971 domain-containing protein [Clostridiales bacterium]|nr:DUF2971 domain-containing protein [Clostridiales bacterium]